MRRFSLRDLFWLTLAAALVLGWGLDRRRLARELEENRIRWVDSVVSENLKRHQAEEALEAANHSLRLEQTPTATAP